MKNCSYTFRTSLLEYPSLSYKELVDLILDQGLVNDVEDIVYSKADRQELYFDSILRHKEEWKTLEPTVSSVINGEPNYGEHLTTLSFIDSNSYIYKGERPIFRQTDEEYAKNLILSFINEGDSEELANQKAALQILNGKLIAEHGLEWHKTVNSFDWIHGDISDFITHCNDTIFESFAGDIYNQINNLRKKLYSRNKLNNISAKIVQGINFKAELENLGEEIYGHIDNLVIDKNGTLHIYNYKITSAPISELKGVKLEKYKHQMALLKQILANNGYDVKNTELHIIPILLKYADDFSSFSDIIVHDPICLNFTNGLYTFNKYDKIAQSFIKSNVTLELSNTKVIDSINLKLKLLFPERDIRLDGIRKTADEWIRLNYNSKFLNRIKQVDGQDYAYDLYLNEDYKNPIHIKSKEHPYKNEEIRNEVIKHLDDLNKDSLIVVNKIIRNIESSRTHGFSTFGLDSGKSFGNSAIFLGKLLNKYFKFTEINGRKIYDYDFIEDDVLSSAGILLFLNRETEAIDIICLSLFNLDSLTKFKDRLNIMGHYITDTLANKGLINYKATFGNIEALKTMAIVNEIIPNFSKNNLVFNDIMVVSPALKGLIQRFGVNQLNRELFANSIKIIKKNVLGVQFINNFLSSSFADPIHEVILSYESIVNDTLLFDKSKREFLKECGFENLEGEENKRSKVLLLQSLLKKLEDNYSFLKTASLQSIIEGSRSSSSPFERRLYTLYKTISEAIVTYSELPANRETLISSLAENGFTLNRVPNRTYLGITNLFTTTIDDITQQANLLFAPILDYIQEYLLEIGFTQIKNSILGNLASLFLNLYRRDAQGNLIMEFRNPYVESDEFGKLNNAERKFLKKVLFTLSKFRELNYGGKCICSCKSWDDPQMKQFAEHPDHKAWFFNVPLTRISDLSLILKGMKAKLTRWVDKAKNLITNSKLAYDDFILNASLEDITLHQEDLQNFSLTNKFIKGDGISSLASRESYLLNNGVDYFEFDLSNILGLYTTEYVRTKELNKTLLTAKSILLHLELLGDLMNGDPGITLTIRMIKDFVKTNIFELSLMEPTSQKIIAWLHPFRELVSKAFIAGNITSAFRDTFEGLWLNMARTANKFLTDIDGKSLATAYKEVVLNAFININSITKIDLLCKLYRLSNMDISRIADTLDNNRSGIFNVDNWLYSTLRKPDFLNRMVLFVARCVKDGSWDAYSVKNGKLDYDCTKDKRYEAFFKGPNTEGYLEAKERYYNAIRLYNKEHSSEELLQYSDKLPIAYSELEILQIRNLSNSIYGAYDKSMRAKYENTALGWAFGTFSTWMNGVVNNYMTKPGEYYDGLIDPQQETDDSGNLLWFDDNGLEITEIKQEDGTSKFIDSQGNEVLKTKNFSRIMENVPRIVQGIWYTLSKDLLPALKHKDFKGEIWEDPVNRANMKKLFSDGLLAMIFLGLFKLAIGPAYSSYKKDMKDYSPLQNAIAEVLYKSTSRSYDGFLGMANVILYLGENTNPPVYSLPIKVTTDAAKFVFGDKTFGLILHSDVAIFKTFLDTYKAMNA